MRSHDEARRCVDPRVTPPTQKAPRFPGGPSTGRRLSPYQRVPECALDLAILASTNEHRPIACTPVPRRTVEAAAAASAVKSELILGETCRFRRAPTSNAPAPDPVERSARQASAAAAALTWWTSPSCVTIGAGRPAADMAPSTDGSVEK